jgi:hypothetical protein
MARTRSKPSAKETRETQSSSIESKPLPPSDTNPSKLFILPTGASHEARIVTLPDPANGHPSRFYLCPEKGLYEFNEISAPRADPRSWLLSSDGHEVQDTSKTGSEEEKPLINRPAYLSRSQSLFIATPIDALFLLLPILSPEKQLSKGTKKSMFITFDDHIDMVDNLPTQLKSILLDQSYRSIFEKRLTAICDVVDAGEDSMFRMSQSKLATTMLKKAIRAAGKQLPQSMEDRFVTRVLQKPLVSMKREQPAIPESATVVSQDIELPDTQTSSPSETITQVTSSESVGTSVTSTFSNIVTPSEFNLDTTANDEVRSLLRIRTSLNFILRTYVPKHLHNIIEEELSKTGVVNFEPLERHLDDLQKIHAEAKALRTISDNISRKRSHEEDESAETKAEKKRRMEEEEKKKKSESRAIKELKKVDTSGMKKLSAFFTKGPKQNVKT